MKSIEFNKDKFERLKKEHSKAVEEGRESFFLDGDEFLVDYAKYLIEYLGQQFEEPKNEQDGEILSYLVNVLVVIKEIFPDFYEYIEKNAIYPGEDKDSDTDLAELRSLKEIIERYV